MLSRPWFIAITCLCLPFIGVAQKPACNLVLTGHVVDEHNNEELSFATVYVPDQDKGAVANEHGGFQMDGLCPGTLTVVVAHVGCEPDTIRFVLASDTHIHLKLEHHIDLLESIKVEAVKPHQDIHPVCRIDSIRVQRITSSSIARLLDDEPGLQMLSTGGNISKPMIHGMHSNRVVLVSGRTRLESQQWGGEHAPELDALTGSEVEVLQGASGLRYGPEAIAGVVIIRDPPLWKTKGWNGWIHLAGESNGRRGVTGLMVQGRLHPRVPLFARVHGTIGRGGDMKAPDYYLVNTGSFDRNWSTEFAWGSDKAGVEYRYAQVNTDLGILNYAHIGNMTDLINALASDTPLYPVDTFGYRIHRPYQHVEHETMAAHAWWRPGASGAASLHFDLARQYNLRQEYDKRVIGANPEDPDLQYEITSWNADARLEHRLSGWYKYEVGASFVQQANTYTGRFFIPNFLSAQVGGYIVQHLELGRSEVEAGLRYDRRALNAFMYRNGVLYSPEREFGGWAWNVGYRLQLKRWSALVNAGRAWRPPAINELYSNGIHHGASAFEMGDELLNEERVWNLNASLGTNELTVLKRKLNVRATGFVYYFDQYIYLEPQEAATLTIRGAFPTFAYRGIESLWRGFDFDARYELEKWFKIQLTYEMVRTNHVASNAYLVGVPADRLQVRYTFLIPDKTNLPELSLEADYHAYQWRYPAGVDYARPPDAVILLHAQLNGVVVWNERSLSYALSVRNIADAGWRSYTNRLRYYADEPGRSFVVSVRIPLAVK